MKISHIVALLKNDVRLVWAFIPLAGFYAYLSTKDFRPDQMFELKLDVGSGILLFMVPFLLWNFLFQNRNFGVKTTTAPSVASLEFMFTRAIDRISLFCAKASFFLILSATPLVATWVYSFTAPTVRVELPYNSHQHREDTKQFFLSHFVGAYLQVPDTGTNKDYVVLPHGRSDQAACIFMLAFAATVLFQVVLFTFTKGRWIIFMVFYLMLLILPFAGLGHSPSLYETTVAWITLHAFQALAALFVLTAAAQLYCCRRFVNTEITSGK